MDAQVKAAEYKKRTSKPSSGLINDTFRCIKEVARPDSRAASDGPRGKSSLAPLAEKQQYQRGGGVGTDVYMHSLRRTLLPGSRQQSLRKYSQSDDADESTALQHQQTPPVEREFLEVEQSSLVCCEVAVAKPSSGKGIWSSPYALVPVVPTQRQQNGEPLGIEESALSLRRREQSLQSPLEEGGAVATTNTIDPLLVYRHVEQRLQRELVFLSCSNATHGAPASFEGNEAGERFRVFRECAQHLGIQIEGHAPVVRRLIDEYNAYVDHLEHRCLQVNTAERERDESLRRMEEVRQRCDLQLRRNAEEYAARLETIQSTLRTHRSVEALVGTIKGLEQTIVAEQERCRALQGRIQDISFLREEFEKSLHHVEESFLLISGERDMELSDYRRERLRAYEELMHAKDECRQTVADMQMRLDAQQIVLETQMQREQMSSDQIRDLQLYSLTLMQQVESLKKQLSELNARAISTEMSPRSGTNATPLRTVEEDDHTPPEHEHPTLGRMSGESPRSAKEESPRIGRRGSMHHMGSSPRGSAAAAVTSAKITASSIAADLGLSQLSTPRPNKAEIIARMPDLGDPSKYPSTTSIIKAMLNQFDFTAKRLADATHTLNKLEERIEIVVLARAELLSREKLQRLMEERGFGHLEESVMLAGSAPASPTTRNP